MDGINTDTLDSVYHPSWSSDFVAGLKLQSKMLS